MINLHLLLRSSAVTQILHYAVKILSTAARRETAVEKGNT